MAITLAEGIAAGCVLQYIMINHPLYFRLTTLIKLRNTFLPKPTLVLKQQENSLSTFFQLFWVLL
jgi:hypothetical protein